MKNSIIWRLTGFSILHWLICIFAGALGWGWQSTIVMLASGLLIFFCFTRWQVPLWATALTVSPFFLTYIPASLYVHNILNYPVWVTGLIACILVTILLGSKTKNAIILTLLALLSAIEFEFVYPNYFSFFTQSYPGDYSLFGSKLVDSNGKEITQQDLKGKVVLFDLWHSTCISCLREMPQLQQGQDIYKNDSSVLIVSLNIPLQQDHGIRPSRYTDAYSFTKLYFQDTLEYKKFAERAVPLVLIMDKEGQCRYAGQLNTDWNIYVGNAPRIINQLKHEK